MAELIPKICLECGKEFMATTRNPGKKCCSRACANSLIAKSRDAGRARYYATTKIEDRPEAKYYFKKNPRPLVAKDCVICGTSFMSPNTFDGRKKKCCSPECTYELRAQLLAKGRATEGIVHKGAPKGVGWSDARRAAQKKRKKPKKKPVRVKKANREKECSICGNTFNIKGYSNRSTCSDECLHILRVRNMRKIAEKLRKKRQKRKRKPVKKIRPDVDWLGNIPEDIKEYNEGVFKEFMARKKSGEDVRLVFVDKTRYHISAPGNPENI